MPKGEPGAGEITIGVDVAVLPFQEKQIVEAAETEPEIFPPTTALGEFAGICTVTTSPLDAEKTRGAV